VKNTEGLNGYHGNVMQDREVCRFMNLLTIKRQKTFGKKKAQLLSVEVKPRGNKRAADLSAPNEE